jgi:hypothetical protein
MNNDYLLPDETLTTHWLVNNDYSLPDETMITHCLMK